MSKSPINNSPIKNVSSKPVKPSISDLIQRFIKALFILPVIIFSIQSCDDQNQQDRFRYTFPEDEPVYYTEHVAPFLLLRCSYTGCHASNSQAGGIDLGDYFRIMAGPNLVNTSSPEASLILQVMDGRNPHLSNLRQVPATENQTQGIRRWIEDGAEI